jgi:hypothetical protein
MPRGSLRRRRALVAASVLALAGCGARTDIALLGELDASAPDVAVAVYDAALHDASIVDVREEPDARDAHDAGEGDAGAVQYLYPCARNGGQCEYSAPDGGCVIGVAILQQYYLPCNIYGQVCCVE